jgi:hypothetical protein
MLKNAASLLVEFDDQTPEAAAPPDSAPATQAPAGAARSATDALWADLEKDAVKPKSPAPAARPSVATATRTIDDIVRAASGPNLDQIKVQPESLPPVSKPDGGVDFAAIYRAANLPPAPFTAEQVLQMIEALPKELPLETRRQTVKVSVQAMGSAIGATPENIVADASRKLAALTAYTEHMTQMTGEFATMAERKIAALQAQIDETKRSVAAAKAREARETQLCTDEGRRLEEVLGFFSATGPDAGSQG